MSADVSIAVLDVELRAHLDEDARELRAILAGGAEESAVLPSRFCASRFAPASIR